MTYRVTSLDCAADGMERLRNQREAILVAYASTAEETAESILAELCDDIGAAAFPEASSDSAIESAVREWAADGGLARIEAELGEARSAAERGDLNWNDSAADEFDSVAFRLYVAWPESDEWPRLSICADCLEAVANGLDSCDSLDPEGRAAVAAGIARETSDGSTLAPDCEEDCEGAFSWSPCELCQRPEGGARHRLAVHPPRS